MQVHKNTRVKHVTRHGLRCEIAYHPEEKVKSANLFLRILLLSQEADIAVSGMTITAERERVIDFTVSGLKQMAKV